MKAFSRNKLMVAGLAGASLLSYAAVAQTQPQSPPRPQPISAWSAKPTTLTPWTAPNKPLWKLTDILAKHKGQADWSEQIVHDADFNGSYISMAPGKKTKPTFYADNRIFWVVQDGSIRFEIQGQEPFVATKGYLVQVPERVPFSMETVGDKPSLRFEVVDSRATPLYPIDQTPTPRSGKDYVKVSFTGQGQYDDTNHPYLDFQKTVVEGGAKGGAFVKDDTTFANVIRGPGAPPAPPSNFGHFHVDYSEFWFILEGKVDYLIEGEPLLTAEQGDIVYAPMGRWHRASWGGTGMATRLAINPRPNGMHNYQPR